MRIQGLGTRGGFALLAMMLVAGWLVGCGGSASQTPSAEEIDKQPWEVVMESPIDTVSVTTYGENAEMAGSDPYQPDPPEGEEYDTPILDQPQVTETQTPITVVEVPDPQVFTPGWRVQIFASSSMVNADELARVARGTFAEPVYVEYIPPMYKVRVGDFMTRKDADHMKARVEAKKMDAFVVEALVVKPS
jgi:cell division septation protein DedD